MTVSEEYHRYDTVNKLGDGCGLMIADSISVEVTSAVDHIFTAICDFELLTEQESVAYDAISRSGTSLSGVLSDTFVTCWQIVAGDHLGKN